MKFGCDICGKMSPLLRVRLGKKQRYTRHLCKNCKDNEIKKNK